MAFSNGPTVVTNGLVLSLDAADRNSYPGSGTTWTDLTGNGYNGTLTNGPTFSSANGGSIVFDGVDDKVTFPSSTISTPSGVTVEVWFNSTSGTKYQDIFDTQDTTGIWIVTNFSGAGTGKISTSFNTLTSYITSNYSANNWYQVVLAGASTTNTQYINGSVSGTGAQTVPTSVVLTNARIGNVDGDRASEYFVGSIPIFRIYNRALTATEVQQNYLSTKSRFGL